MKCSRCRNDAVEGKTKCDECRQKQKVDQAVYRAINWWVRIITNTKHKDIKKGLYDPDEHVDKELLQYQFEEQDGKCFYCDVAMVTFSAGLGSGKADPNRMSIERMDNRGSCWTHQRKLHSCFLEV